MSLSAGNDLDCLHNIITFAKFYFSHKYLKTGTDYSMTCGIFYICALLYNLFKNPSNVIEQDVFLGAIISEMIVTKVSLEILRPTITKLLSIKTEQFWSYEFLILQEKRCFKREMMLFVLLNTLLWLFALVIVIIVIITHLTYPKFVFNETWPFIWKIIFKICYCAFVTFGYYSGNTLQSYYIYVLLNNYFQMKMVMVFVRRSMAQNEQKQDSVREILKCTIQHFQTLKFFRYGNEITYSYSKLSPYHFIIGAIVIAIGVHCTVFSDTPNSWFVAMVTVHLGYGALIYINISHLFAEIYHDFCLELQKVKWYKMDIVNQKLYYMLLMYSQMRVEVEILPSVPVTRPLLTKFLKLIYGGITLLRSINK